MGGPKLGRAQHHPTKLLLLLVSLFMLLTMFMGSTVTSTIAASSHPEEQHTQTRRPSMKASPSSTWRARVT